MENQTQDKTQDGAKAYSRPDRVVEWEKERARQINEEVGKLQGYDCKECKNKGYIAAVTDTGYMVARRCSCMTARDTIKLAKQSGAYALMQKHSFANFNTACDWQAKMKNIAEEYANEQTGWLFAGGQTGAGKTHLCTAAFKAFIKKRISGLYILWRDEARRLLRSSFADSRETEERIVEIKQAGVLYIDDLFKTDDNQNPDKREIELAFEILNFRYNNDLPTIISSEMDMQRLAGLNQAIAGRIRQQCGKHYIGVSYDTSRNWRLNQP